MLQQIESPPDKAGHTVELALLRDADRYCWAVTVRAPDRVVASRWLPLDELRGFAAWAGDPVPGTWSLNGVAMVRERIPTSGPVPVAVTVTAGDGEATAWDHTRALAHAAAVLVERAEHDGAGPFNP